MWLLEKDAYLQLSHAIQNTSISAEQQAQFNSRVDANEKEPAGYSVRGNTAQINIKGVLTKTPNFFAMFFGGGNTTYPDIISAVTRAESDPNVEKIVYKVDSPGGNVDGMFDAIAAMQMVKKPTKAIVDGTAASAAYALASQADTIEAASQTARVGSIGVVATFYLHDDEISVTSTNAPNKRPDVRTEEGKKIVREELDAYHDLFVDSIASGRNTSAKEVNAAFGQGSVFLAKQALKRGMIDVISGPRLKAVDSSNTGKTAASAGGMEIKLMDLKTLIAEHPGVYEAAVNAGVEKERDRVSAHLIAGEHSGDMETAVKAAVEGTAMTEKLRTQYMMKAANRGDQTARDRDSADAAAALESAKLAETSKKSESELVADLVEAGLGIGADA